MYPTVWRCLPAIGENGRKIWIAQKCLSMIQENKKMLRTLVAFLPDSMMVFVIMIVGLCLMVGALSPRKAKQWLGYVVLLLITAPFYDVVLDMMPRWLLLALLVIAAWMLFRFIAEAVLGRAAAAHMMGILAADVVRGTFRLILILAAMPFRLVRYAFRAAR